MADQFDEYREALVMETVTDWSSEYDSLDAGQKQQIERALHAAPAECEQIEYVRQHSGFCRKITVTDEDIARVQAS